MLMNDIRNVMIIRNLMSPFFLSSTDKTFSSKQVPLFFD